jgi:hypothetical protein
MAGPYLVEEDARGRRRAAAAAGGSGLATARPCISLAATARAETRERGRGRGTQCGTQQKGTARRQKPFFNPSTQSLLPAALACAAAVRLAFDDVVVDRQMLFGHFKDCLVL